MFTRCLLLTLTMMLLMIALDGITPGSASFRSTTWKERRSVGCTCGLYLQTPCGRPGVLATIGVHALRSDSGCGYSCVCRRGMRITGSVRRPRCSSCISKRTEEKEEFIVHSCSYNSTKWLDKIIVGPYTVTSDNSVINGTQLAD